jgi:hypothetical protein
MTTQHTEFSAAPGNNGFDFDAWVKLAATDPAAFERAKRELLMQAVGEAPEGQRAQLTGLVDQLMAPPAPNATGLDRAVAAHNAMMQGFHSLQKEMVVLQTHLGGAPEAAVVDASLAEFTALTTAPR